MAVRTFAITGRTAGTVSRRVWASMRTDLVLDALEQAIHAGGHDALTGLVHHRDQAVRLSLDAVHRPPRRRPHRAVRRELRQCVRQFPRRVVIWLFKTEVIQRRGPWRSLEAVEVAMPVWVDCSTAGGCSRPSGDTPPA